MMLPYFMLILLLTIVHFPGERDAPLSIVIRDLPRLSFESPWQTPLSNCCH